MTLLKNKYKIRMELGFRMPLHQTNETTSHV